MNLNVENFSLKKGAGLWMLGTFLFLLGLSAMNYGDSYFTPDPVLYVIGIVILMCSVFPLVLSAEVFFRHAIRRLFSGVD